MDVAALMEISSASISAYENGHEIPTVPRLKIFAQVYDADYEDLRRLRDQARQARRLSAGEDDQTDLLPLLQDIRFLLVQIRDSLK